MSRLLIFLIFISALNLHADEAASEGTVIDGTVESEISVTGTDLTIQLKNATYVIKPEIAALDRAKKNLSKEDFEAFLGTRTEVLTLVAKALQAAKWGFGVGLIVKNHFQFRAEKSGAIQIAKEALQMDGGQRADLLAAMERQRPALEIRRSEIKNKSFKEKSNEMIGYMVEALDGQLWNQAAIVAHANEFGFIAAIGVQAEGGTISGKGKGGLTDFGVSFGYNRDDKAIAFQIFNDLEGFKSTQMPVVMIGGVVVKIGPYVANQNKEMSAEGSSFYPPMTPGFSSSTNRSFMFGYSSGLTLPPSPIGDLLTYTNTLKQTVLLRLTISPLTKGFVRLTIGSFRRLFGFGFLKRRANSVRCEALF